MVAQAAIGIGAGASDIQVWGRQMVVQAGIFAAASLLMWAAVGDVARRVVPNWLSLALASVGVLLRFCGGTLPASLFAAFIVFVLAAFCWRRGLMGGGDVKLLAASSLLVSPWLVPTLVLLIALAGGVLGLAYCVMRLLLPAPSRVRPRAMLARILRIERHRIHRGFSLPYASAIAAGGVFALLKG